MHLCERIQETLGKVIEIMEESKKKISIENDKDIIFTKAIKAGKRIYYLDVKKNRKNELYLAITESKKVYSDNGEDAKVTFEKHKIFLYQEDFEKFSYGLNEALDYIRLNQSIPEHVARTPENEGKQSRNLENENGSEDTFANPKEQDEASKEDGTAQTENDDNKPKSDDDELNITF